MVVAGSSDDGDEPSGSTEGSIFLQWRKSNFLFQPKSRLRLLTRVHEMRSARGQPHDDVTISGPQVTRSRLKLAQPRATVALQ